MEASDLTGNIIHAAIEVHNHLGPGLLENVYEHCLLFELNQRGIKAVSQVALPVIYKECRIDIGYRIDILVEDSVIVELKSVNDLLPLHKAQLFSYLKLSDLEFGLLINFNNKLLKHGISRIFNPTYTGNSKIKFYSSKDVI